MIPNGNIFTRMSYGAFSLADLNIPQKATIFVFPKTISRAYQ